MLARDDGPMSSSPLTFEVTANRAAAWPATVEIVVPVYNEESDLEASVRRLHAYLGGQFPLTWLITIVDNASTDGTSAEARLPLVEDEGWFFDTELLVLAEHNGLRIHEVPVDWVDDPESRVDVVSTAMADLAGVWRMARRIATGRASVLVAVDGQTAPSAAPDLQLSAQLARFASIGVVSTIVFGALVALLAPPFGLLLADLLALAVCSVANPAG